MNIIPPKHPPAKNNTTWERVIRIFYTKNIATLGIVFASNHEFHGKSVISITVSQHVLKTKCGVASAGALVMGKTAYIAEPLAEMNGIFAWYEKSGMPSAIEIEGPLLLELISLVNHDDTKIHRFFVNMLSRDMTFWSSGASVDSVYFSSLEELEKSSIAEFSTPVGDDMHVPDSIATHVYFEPKVEKLIDLIKDNRDSTGKADARNIHKLLKQCLNLNDDDAWSVFDYAAKFKGIEEVEEINVRYTGKKLPSIEKADDWA
ncbi:MAG: hypothetical protein OI715_00855 (plasmid) [Candidatus Methanoperedens sp.]|nr:MAG: hypothetical protein OI715_00855 [Candidatus Methanoperedens sp.]